MSSFYLAGAGLASGEGRNSLGSLFWVGVAGGGAAVPPRRVPWEFRCPPLPAHAPSRKEEAVRGLKDASQLVINIALGHPIPLPRHPSRHPAGQQPLRRGRWGALQLP